MRKVGVWGTPRYAQIWKSTILSKNWLMYIQLLSVLSINLTLHRWVRTLLWWVRTLRWWVRTLRTALEHTWIDDQLILLFTLLETCSPAYHNTQLWFLCRHPGDFWIIRHIYIKCHPRHHSLTFLVPECRLSTPFNFTSSFWVNSTEPSSVCPYKRTTILDLKWL